MQQVPSGSRIRVVRNSNSHDYELNKVYVVTRVDTDGTFKAKDPSTGKEGNWLRWGDCEPASDIGWKFCKEVLPQEVIALLSAFDGIEQIELSRDVKDKILLGLPDLYERILDASASLELEKSAASDDDDDDDDDDESLF